MDRKSSYRQSDRVHRIGGYLENYASTVRVSGSAGSTSGLAPSLGLIRPVVKRPFQIPIHCVREVREEVNPWTKNRPTPSLGPNKLTTSLVDIKTHEHKSLDISESRPETTMKSPMLSLSAGNVWLGIHQAESVISQVNYGCGDLVHSTVAASSFEKVVKEKDNLKKFSTVDTPTKSPKSKNYEINSIPAAPENVIIAVQDNMEGLSLSFSSNSDSLCLADFLLTDSGSNTVESRSSTSPCSDLSFDNNSEVNPYGLKALVETFSLQATEKNPHATLLATGYNCDKLLDGLRNSSGLKYYGPFVGAYENIDHDNCREVGLLATNLPQRIRRRCSDEMAELIVKHSDGNDLFLPEVVMSSLLMTELPSFTEISDIASHHLTSD